MPPDYSLDSTRPDITQEQSNERLLVGNRPGMTQLLPLSGHSANEVNADRWKFAPTYLSAPPPVHIPLYKLAIKRCFDIIISIAALALSLPLILIAILAIKRIKGGPILYRSPRVGRLGLNFFQLTFNVSQPKTGPKSRALRILKRLGCRILPSFINVLRGEMSIVGPEPATAEEFSRYSEIEFQRLRVKPGLTCFWTLRRHSNIGFDEKLACDLAYVKKLGLLTDLGIILRTIFVQIIRGSKQSLQERIQILGVKFHNLTMPEAVDLVTIACRRRSMWTVFFINADCMNIACKDEKYYRILQQADALFPDGIGIHLASRLLTTSLKENTNGTDFFPRLCRQATENGLSLFLLGAAPGIAEAAAKNMTALFPNLKIVGTQHGYFTREEETGVIGRINESGADILLVAMGAPRQEKWIASNRSRITSSVVMGVGGLFDFYSGKIPRAPIWMRELGLEWVYRLIQEPKRLWKRYVVGNPLFLYRVLRWRSNHPAKLDSIRQHYMVNLYRRPVRRLNVGRNSL